MPDPALQLAGTNPDASTEAIRQTQEAAKQDELFNTLFDDQTMQKYEADIAQHTTGEVAPAETPAPPDRRADVGLSDLVKGTQPKSWSVVDLARDVRDQSLVGAVDGALEMADFAIEGAKVAVKPLPDFVQKPAESVLASVEAGRAALQDKWKEIAPKPETVPGNFAKSIAQFVAGSKLLKLTGAQSALSGLGVSTTANQAIRGAIVGAGAFDPYEARLSNMVQDVPLLGYFASMVAANPQDSGSTARLKAMAEQAGFGIVFESTMAFAKNVRFADRMRRIGVMNKDNPDTVEKGLSLAQRVEHARAHKIDAKAAVGAVRAAAADGDQGVAQAATKAAKTEASTLKQQAMADFRDFVNGEEFKGLSPEAQQEILRYARDGSTKEALGARVIRNQKIRLSDENVQSVVRSIRNGLVDPKVDQLAQDFNTALMDGTDQAFDAMNALAKELRRAPAAVGKGTTNLLAGVDSPRTFAQSSRFIAKELNTPESQLLQRLAAVADVTQYAGEIMDAAEFTLVASSQRLHTLSRIIDRTVPEHLPAEVIDEFLSLSDGTGNLYRFLKGSQTNIARALNLRKLRSGFHGRAIPKETLEAAISGVGGREGVQRLAKRIIAAGESPGATARSTLVTVGEKASQIRRGIYTYFVNSILSGPATHMVNATSNATVALYDPIEQAVSYGFQRLFATGNPLHAATAAGGDIVASYAPFFEATGLLFKAAGAALRMTPERGAPMYTWAAAEKLGIKAFLKSLWTGQGQTRFGEITSRAGELGVGTEGVVSEAARLTGLGRAVDWLGKTIRFPTRMLTSVDAGFVDIAYFQGLRREAYRRGMAQGLRGQSLSKFMSDFPDTLTPEEFAAFKEKVLQPIAARNTFQDELDSRRIAHGIQQFARKHPALKFFVPFIRTPANLIKYAHERTPVLNIASRRLGDVVRREGSVAAAMQTPEFSDFLARTTLGAGAYYTIYSLHKSGRLTGGAPNDRFGRARFLQDHAEYSIRVGNKWYAYNRLDPVGLIFGVAADFFSYGDTLLEHDFSTFSDALAFSIINNLGDRNYLSGVTMLLNVLTDPDQFGPSLKKQLIGSVVPNFFNQTLGSDVKFDIRALQQNPNAGRPTHLELQELWNVMRARSGSPDFPHQYTIFGPVERFGRMSSIATRMDADLQDPVGKELDKQGVNILLTGKTDTIHGTLLSPDQREALNQSIVNDKLLSGKTLHEALQATIASEAYKNIATDAENSRPKMLKTVVDAAVKAGKARLLIVDQDLQRKVREDARTRILATTQQGQAQLQQQSSNPLQALRQFNQ
jgi:hypothetical protein